MGEPDFRALVRPDDAARPFAYVDPPFNFNASAIATYPPEVSGHFLLRSLCLRLGWTSLAGRRLLDFGCGVRFTRTIINLQLDIAEYTGVDVNAKVIEWDRANIKDPRFRFEHLPVRNLMYNPTSTTFLDPSTLVDRGLSGFDAACMFSVITHQDPAEAEAIFAALHPCVAPGGGRRRGG